MVIKFLWTLCARNLSRLFQTMGYVDVVGTYQMVWGDYKANFKTKNSYMENGDILLVLMH